MAERKKVLLVEDDESVRQLVRVTLQMNEYEVIEAKDGLEGLLFLDMHKPDAVVLDLMMPDVGGERMLAQLRQTEETRRTPVVIITGKPEVAPEVVGLVGQENFFPKPFDPDAVIDRLNALVG
ncbi:MAG TPA: response regulator [Actinomycetota bacterium]|jgi:DNA-binding response OmpR family regulator|nr:response regulator [Actinomycetota bacterium]